MLVGVAQAAQGADPNTATPGLVGFVITVLLFVAVYLLFKSLKKQLGRVDVPFAGEAPGGGPEELESAGDPGDAHQA